MANNHTPCLPCERARRAGVGAQIWSIGSTTDAEYCRARRYAVGGAIGIVALWGFSLWWLTR